MAGLKPPSSETLSVPSIAAESATVTRSYCVPGVVPASSTSSVLSGPKLTSPPKAMVPGLKPGRVSPSRNTCPPPLTPFPERLPRNTAVLCRLPAALT